jgi:hypothetical protein
MTSSMRSTNVGRHSGRPNCAGSEDVTRDHRCAHLTPSVTPLARTSHLCVAVATRTSRGTACSPALEVPPPRGPGDAAACPPKGPAVARPLDREPPPLLRIEESPPPRVEVRERGHRLWVHRRAYSQTTAVVARAVVNESVWSVKN